jgi:hypothetical protein
MSEQSVLFLVWNLSLILSYAILLFGAVENSPFMPNRMYLSFGMLGICARAFATAVRPLSHGMVPQNFPPGIEFACAGALVHWGNGPKFAVTAFIGFGLIAAISASYRTFIELRSK